ncbi:hypothetical protein SAMN05518861_10627 [Mesorhizobium sp. YR577]|nr:hypothetical protein SAMN05518861_10627 [Mesorhizobium sp. YR577]
MEEKFFSNGGWAFCRLRYFKPKVSTRRPAGTPPSGLPAALARATGLGPSFGPPAREISCHQLGHQFCNVEDW